MLCNLLWAPCIQQLDVTSSVPCCTYVRRLSDSLVLILHPNDLKIFQFFFLKLVISCFLQVDFNTRISALTNLFGYAFWVQGNSFMDCMFNCLQDIHRLNVVLYFVAIQQSINHRAILGFCPCHVASLLLLLCVTWNFHTIYKSTKRCVGD
jgi:hypothetical protein